MKNTGLTEQEWQVIRKNLQSIPKIEKAVLFGSRAMGLARSNSDVDMLLYGDELTLHDVANVKNAFEETTLPYGFDLIIYDANNSALGTHIKDYGQVIFERGNAGWKVVRLGDVCSYISKGIAPNYTDSFQDSIIVLNQKCNRNHTINLEFSRLNNLANKKVPKERVLKEYDILINSTGVGTAGRIAQLKGIIPKMTVDGHMLIVRTTEFIDAEYVGYALINQQKIIENLAEGSTGQTELNKQRLLDEVIIQFPDSIPEQKRIASILSSLDDKIENNNATNKNLEEQAQAIFKSWFVDFEPFKDGEFEDSELGKIPKGWIVGTLGEIMLFKNGKKRNNITGDIPIYGGNGVLGYGNLSNASNIIIIGRVGAYCGSLYFSKEDCWISDNAISCQSKTQCKQGFCFQQLKILQINTRCVGSAQPLLTQEILNSIKIIIPNNIVIEKYDDVFENLYAQIDENLKQNQKLTQLRETLLPKLMSGEVRVPVEVE